MCRQAADATVLERFALFSAFCVAASLFAELPELFVWLDAFSWRHGFDAHHICTNKAATVPDTSVEVCCPEKALTPRLCLSALPWHLLPSPSVPLLRLSALPWLLSLTSSSRQKRLVQLA